MCKQMNSSSGTILQVLGGPMGHCKRGQGIDVASGFRKGLYMPMGSPVVYSPKHTSTGNEK